jgi:hypothetical protein
MRLARPTVLATLSLTLSVAPLAAEAQQSGRVYRIGYLQPAPRESTVHIVKALEDGLRELGSHRAGTSSSSIGSPTDDSSACLISPRNWSVSNPTSSWRRPQ